MKKFKNSKNKWSTNTQGTLWTMRYYRFSRRRKNYLFGLSDYFKSQKKSDYIINTGRSKMLDSGFFENKVWGALCKAWKGYVIAKNKGEYDKMLHYARIIQECQHDLGLPISSFDNIGMTASNFLMEIAEKEGDNNNQEEQEVSYEEYQNDLYEQERFTDKYNEYFEDDENKADRFTS
jgi:hypothetical protein